MGVDLWPSKEGEGYTPTGAYPSEVNDPVSHETLPIIPHHHEESNLKTWKKFGAGEEIYYTRNNSMYSCETLYIVV